MSLRRKISVTKLLWWIWEQIILQMLTITTHKPTMFCILWKSETSEKVMNNLYSSCHVHKAFSESPHEKTQYSINTEIMLNATISMLHFSSFLNFPALVKSVNFKAKRKKMNGWKGSNKYQVPVKSIILISSSILWIGWEVQTCKTSFSCMRLLLIEMILINLDSKISLCAKIQSNGWKMWIVLSG